MQAKKDEIQPNDLKMDSVLQVKEFNAIPFVGPERRRWGERKWGKDQDNVSPSLFVLTHTDTFYMKLCGTVYILHIFVSFKNKYTGFFLMVGGHFSASSTFAP